MSTSELERRPLTPLDIGETKAAQKLYQDGLKQLLDVSEDVTPIRGRGGKVKNHVNRSGVSKITTWCSLSTTLVSEEIDRDEDGKALRWRVTVRATAPDGRCADGIGAFSLTERSVSKPEHDGLGTAFTRARNRAVMDLVGMGEVSAEELLTDPAPDGSPAPYGPDATAEMRGEALSAIVSLWPAWSASDADWMLNLLAANFGSLPEISVRTIKGLQWCVANPPKHAGPEFEEIVTPTSVEPPPNPSPTEGIPDANPSPTEGLSGDEVDIDAIFDAEQKFME
jgi:hypothetical protein